jgi:uncharacterized protein (TIGR00299 family) protein
MHYVRECRQENRGQENKAGRDHFPVLDFPVYFTTHPDSPKLAHCRITIDPEAGITVKIAYLHCATGISGDMTLAALIDAGVDEARIREAINSLGLPGVELSLENIVKGGFRAKYLRVRHPEQHAHRHFGDIARLIEAAGALTRAQKDLALRIFRVVAEAEARVHGSTVEQVHFHEVGAIDSIVDIVGAAVGFDLLAADQIVCSPLPTGRGHVKIAHGVCPIPAPGTAEILKGIPLADVPVEAELTTPTGAAIARTVADRFGPLPAMTIEQVGYGAGTMNFPVRANVLRLFVGTAAASGETDQVCLLETNLDDVPPEVVGYAKQRLLAAGALDVFSAAIQMKKDRPGVLLSVIAHPADAGALESILFAETGTFGVRRQMLERSKRRRQPHTVETAWGPVAGKLGWRAGESPVFTPEYEACAAIAKQVGVPLRDVFRAVEAAYAAAPVSTPREHQHAVDEPARTPTHVPTHDHSHDHRHDHGHDHSHDHDHGHRHDHDHHHDHG